MIIAEAGYGPLIGPGSDACVTCRDAGGLALHQQMEERPAKSPCHGGVETDAVAGAGVAQNDSPNTTMPPPSRDHAQIHDP